MKKQLILILLAVCCYAGTTYAQVAFPTNDSITINNLNTGVTVHGDMFCDPGIGGYISRHCEFPSGSGKHINLIGALWMSANDAGGQLHCTAQTFRQSGNDFWPGPLDGNDTLTYATAYKWAKIWKINRTDIQAFNALSTHDLSNTPSAILTWPGKGNVNAKGNAGYMLAITNSMAPFVDLNSNGIYEPLMGEYPDIKGDQALWWVFSDNGPAHTETNSKALGVEVHAMVYGYKRNTSIDNVLYYDFDIINRSPNTYNNFRTAVWDDADLGFYGDDYIGFDSVHRMGITYNGVPIDGASSGFPDDAYGANPPITGLSIVVSPGDVGTSYAPAGSFNAHNNDLSIMGNPTTASDYDNYMRAKIRNGAHITNTFGGTGMPCGAFGTGPACNYLYPGDPSDPNQWSECKCNNYPGDKQFILSSGDFSLSAGGSTHFAVALMATPNAGGCGTANFTGIKNLADTAWQVYHNPLPPIPLGISPTLLGSVVVYPNPAGKQLFIEDLVGAGSDAIELVIYNTIGQKMNITPERNNNKYTIDVSNFPFGIYHVLYTKGAAHNSATFVKE